MDAFFEWLTGSFSKWVVLFIMVGGGALYAYLRYGRKPREKKQGNTELIFIEVKAIGKRLSNIEDNSLKTRDDVSQIRVEVENIRANCNKTTGDIYDRINILEVKPESEKNGKAKHTGRVLVVDDEAPITKMLRIYLEDLGYSVLAVNTYDQALKAVNNEHFKWALMDVLLGCGPEKDGYHLWEMFYKKFPDTKCVLFTGHSTGALPTFIQHHLSEVKLIEKINICDKLNKIMSS